MNPVEPYKVDGRVILKSLLLLPSVGWPLWIVLAAGVALMAVGIAVDVRWLVIGLMLCVAVAPGVAAFIYFKAVLSPQVAPNLIPHTLERSDAGFIVRTWRLAEEEDTESTDGWVETGKITLDDSNITERKTSFDYETLYFRDSRLKILYVPRFKQ